MIKQYFLSTLYTLCSIAVAIALSWAILYKCNFAYGFWYEHGGIKETIEYFAPKNKHYAGFENTSKEQRVNAFREINEAVHFSADTLADITFSTKENITQKLLHQREVVHLTDVSNAINILYIVILFMFCNWCYLLFYFKKQQQLSRHKSKTLSLNSIKLPALKNQTFIIIFLLTLITISIFLIGPVNVFYWCHTFIFPDNNQWFFYYEDSLMSTLMSAPDLFGWIAIEWLLLFLISFFTIQITTYQLINKKKKTK